MPLAPRRLTVQNYRSVRRLVLPLDPMTVVIGANGAGKTNILRALELLGCAARGTLAAALAAEGGLEAAIWAGRRSPGEHEARILLEVDLGTPDGFGAPVLRYAVEIGFPMKTAAAFAFEPQVKSERLHALAGRRASLVLERRGGHVMARRAEGPREEIALDLLASETALSRLDEASLHPDVALARRALLDWRVHHGFRTDPAAPLRRPALAVAAPVLDGDGANLAAVLATLAHVRQDRIELDRAVADAFPGAVLEVPPPGREATFGLVFPEHPRRVFSAAELSDGTLRYLALMGALLSYRRPAFLALNEPEASLHPDLLPPLARLVARSTRGSGDKARGALADAGAVLLVTHAPALADGLAESGGARPRRVERDGDGATAFPDLTRAAEWREEDGER